MVLGKELALVVSFKQGESGETFDSGEDAGPGEDFWKKDMIERCLADEDAELPLTALAGVRAPPGAVLSPAMTSDDSDVVCGDAPTLCGSTDYGINNCWGDKDNRSRQAPKHKELTRIQRHGNGHD